MLSKDTEKLWTGLDLAAAEGGISAVAWGSCPTEVQVKELHTDAELVQMLEKAEEVWVDAPLTVGEGPFRACDRALHCRGLSVMPLSWPAMLRLHGRVRRLMERLPQLRWHETFPWAVYRGWGLRHKELAVLRERLMEVGLPAQQASVHECDALAAWWVGWLARKGLALPLSGPDGTLWVPSGPAAGTQKHRSRG